MRASVALPTLLLAAALLLSPGAGQRNRPRPQTTQRPTTGGGDATTTLAPLVDGNGHPLNCPCPTSQEYNPVCGSNGATYNNPSKLRCAQRCGYVVELDFYGNCPGIRG